MRRVIKESYVRACVYIHLNPTLYASEKFKVNYAQVCVKAYICLRDTQAEKEQEINDK